MSPAKKTVLCIASFLPIALGITYLVIMLLNMRSMLFFQLQQPDNDPAVVFDYFRQFIIIIICIAVPMVLIRIALMIIYIIDASRNRAISETERIIWIIAFILFGSISYPLYFFMRIYGVKDEPKPALQQF